MWQWLAGVRELARWRPTTAVGKATRGAVCINDFLATGDVDMCRMQFGEIFEALAQGKKVLVGCKHGKHRTACNFKARPILLTQEGSPSRLGNPERASPHTTYSTVQYLAVLFLRWVSWLAASVPISRFGIPSLSNLFGLAGVGIKTRDRKDWPCPVC